jgi:hypothetical protein
MSPSTTPQSALEKARKRIQRLPREFNWPFVLDDVQAELIAAVVVTALLDPDEGTVEAAARSIDRIEDCTGYYGAAPGLARAAFNAAIQHILKGAEG